MLVVTRYRVPAGETESFADLAKPAVAALSVRPGCEQVRFGRSVDDAELWVLASSWESVGSYRRALSHPEVKLHAVHPPQGLGMQVLERSVGLDVEPVRGGLAIRRVTDGSLAEQKGLRPGDIILGANGQQLDSVERRAPLAPSELRFGRVRMRGDAEAAEAPHVFDHVARLAGKRIRRRRHVHRDVVAAGGADFDGVEAEHPIVGRIGNRKVLLRAESLPRLNDHARSAAARDFHGIIAAARIDDHDLACERRRREAFGNLSGRVARDHTKAQRKLWGHLVRSAKPRARP